MKLNVKKTVQVGFAFLSICAFWQMYNAIIPIILTYTFHMNETISGAIMGSWQRTMYLPCSYCRSLVVFPTGASAIGASVSHLSCLERSQQSS